MFIALNVCGNLLLFFSAALTLLLVLVVVVVVALLLLWFMMLMTRRQAGCRGAQRLLSWWLLNYGNLRTSSASLSLSRCCHGAATGVCVCVYLKHVGKQFTQYSCSRAFGSAPYAKRARRLAKYSCAGGSAKWRKCFFLFRLQLQSKSTHTHTYTHANRQIQQVCVWGVSHSKNNFSISAKPQKIYKLCTKI